MNHTPGAWYPVDYAGVFILQTTPEYSPDNDLLSAEDTRQAEANAYLAAAAPTLLRTIETAYVLLKHLHNSGQLRAPYTLKAFENAIQSTKKPT